MQGFAGWHFSFGQKLTSTLVAEKPRSALCQTEPFSQDYAEPPAKVICHLSDETGVAATDQTVTDSEAETGRYRSGGPDGSGRKRGRVPGEIKRSREILEGRGGAGPSILPRL